MNININTETGLSPTALFYKEKEYLHPLPKASIIDTLDNKLYTYYKGNLDTLELVRIRENIDKYIDMITDGSKTFVDALYELTQMEINFSMEAVIKGNVKVANFPFSK